MRVAIASLQHETNSYCPSPTGLSDFHVVRGSELVSRARGTATALGGWIAGCHEIGAELVPLVAAGASPSGVIAADAYRELRDEIEAALLRAGPVDALALALHGAACAEGVDDVEADLCQRLRDCVGPAVPIVATFDLHGNVSQAMADALAGIFCYRAYPHIDTFERGQAGAHALPVLAARRVRPVTHVERLPLLVPAATTLFGPAHEANLHCERAAAKHGVIDCTFFHGFPYADHPGVGASVVATADGDRALAREAARAAASAIWESRELFRPNPLSCAEAIAAALAVEGGPVVINETSDNPGGGAPGDGTHLLRALLEAGVEDACFATIADPEAARRAHAAGVGAVLELELGGKRDRLHGEPLRVRAEVSRLSDGRFTLRDMLAGVELALGPMARLRIGGIDVLVASRSQQVFDPEIFRLHGIDVRRKRIVALKSSHHFRAGFQAVARAIVTADPPGLTTQRIEDFARARTPRPIWPLDAGARYPEART